MRWRDVPELVRRNTGILIVLLAIITGGLYYLEVGAREDAERCQANYNIALSSQLTTRAQLLEEADNQRDRLLREVAVLVLSDPPIEEGESGERFRNAFSDYIAASDALSEIRRTTPLPELPDCYR